jgi:hypothetical protein
VLNALRIPEVRRLQGKEKPPDSHGVNPTKDMALSKDNLCNWLFYAISSVMVPRMGSAPHFRNLRKLVEVIGFGNANP